VNELLQYFYATGVCVSLANMVFTPVSPTRDHFVIFPRGP
jgi:hypothetical protein